MKMAGKALSAIGYCCAVAYVLVMCGQTLQAITCQSGREQWMTWAAGKDLRNLVLLLWGLPVATLAFWYMGHWLGAPLPWSRHKKE
jgi:hypothetical protein